MKDSPRLAIFREEFPTITRGSNLIKGVVYTEPCLRKIGRFTELFMFNSVAAISSESCSERRVNLNFSLTRRLSESDLFNDVEPASSPLIPNYPSCRHSLHYGRT